MLRQIATRNALGVRSFSSLPKLPRYSPSNDLRQLDLSDKVNLGIQIVPHQEARVVEWFGKFDKVLSPGIHLLIPFVQKVKYTHSLKERMLRVEPQMCWTKDNVQVYINGNVFVQVEDPVKASYSVEQPYSMIYQMAFSTMRAEVGLLELDDLLNNRDQINEAISTSIRPRTEEWGLKLIGYEIQDIEPQEEVLADLTKQSKAERDRREAVKASEGERQVLINRSEGEMQAITNKARAQADARVMIAEAEATAIRKVTEELSKESANETVRYNIAQEMSKAWTKMAENSPTILLPQDASNVNSLVAQAMGTYEFLKSHKE